MPLTKEEEEILKMDCNLLLEKYGENHGKESLREVREWECSETRWEY